MSWGKPRNVWQWLLVLTPAVEMMALQAEADRWGPALFGNSEIPGLTLVILNVIVVFAVSLALGVSWFWHCPDWAERFLKGGAAGVAVAVVNITIGTVGSRIGCTLFHKQ
ncbi:MAG: hypothetical protein ABJF10_10115 [Chthoniobacter sp.]|uniref:hypothetical protein n=1 Tax=Chthoniobacter sp. TaxID=2510640 RepID=UPI0032A26996